MESKLNRLAEIIDELASRGQEIIHDEELRERLRQVRNKMRHLIETYPVASVASALLLGVLIARLFSSEEE